MYLAHLDTTGTGVGNLKRLVIGGSAVPRAMAETFRAKYGVTVLQLWGMTETNPLGVISTPSPLLMAEGEDFANDLLLTKQGRMQFGIELRIIRSAARRVGKGGVSKGRSR